MSSRSRKGREEARLRGVAVSEGVGVGRVLRIHGGAREQIFKATLDEEGEAEREARRFRAAVRLARRQLLAIKKRAERALGTDHAYIFDAQLLMLEDRKLLDEVEAHISRERVNAEWALKVVTDRLLAVYAEIKDDYLRERSSDIEDVAGRLLVALSGESLHPRRITEDAVIVAEELMPSAVAELDFARVRAIATDMGGWTSHTAIIARGLGIPAVVGLRELYRRSRTGDEIIVDARSGEVVLHPMRATVESVREGLSEMRGAFVESCASAEEARKDVETADGARITLRANVELPPEFDGVRRYGAQGIGLYRSEFLMSQRGHVPEEEEQYRTYVDIAKLGGEDGATIRLFDLGGDKLSADFNGEDGRNPALGLRAIRFSLRNESILRTQARAVLRASAHGKLDLVLPMISDLKDVRRAKAVIENERKNLKSEGREIGSIRIGAMIEVPSAVIVADRLAREVDFFSLGTNDLVQYLLAVDRVNDDVAEWFRSLHPAVLESVRRTLSAAKEAGIGAIVCGEMAATSAYAVVLVGLGARDLSMTPSSIPRVRRTLSQIDTKRAEEIALECLGCETAEDAEEVVRKRLSDAWPKLFPPESLPPPKGEG